jgi:hypothetical protein
MSAMKLLKPPIDEFWKKRDAERANEKISFLPETVIMVNGMTVTQLSIRYGIKSSVIHKRLRSGVTDLEDLIRPVGMPRKTK